MERRRDCGTTRRHLRSRTRKPIHRGRTHCRMARDGRRAATGETCGFFLPWGRLQRDNAIHRKNISSGRHAVRSRRGPFACRGAADQRFYSAHGQRPAGNAHSRARQHGGLQPHGGGTARHGLFSRLHARLHLWAVARQAIGPHPRLSGHDVARVGHLADACDRRQSGDVVGTARGDRLLFCRALYRHRELAQREVGQPHARNRVLHLYRHQSHRDHHRADDAGACEPGVVQPVRDGLDPRFRWRRCRSRSPMSASPAPPDVRSGCVSASSTASRRSALPDALRSASPTAPSGRWGRCSRRTTAST